MQFFVRGTCTMIAAAVQRDVDGIPKGSHYVLLKRDNGPTFSGRAGTEPRGNHTDRFARPVRCDSTQLAEVSAWSSRFGAAEDLAKHDVTRQNDSSASPYRFFSIIAKHSTSMWSAIVHFGGLIPR